MPDPALHLLAIPGSLRSGSFNRALARTLPQLAPDGVRVDVWELHDVPLYNSDLDEDGQRPDSVVDLKGDIEAADGLILVSPEYNFGVPGVLKNAIDWASRPGFRSPMAGKPTGIMGASAGLSGTMRAQEQLKLNLLGMVAQVFPHPGVAVRKAGDKVHDGHLTDEDTRSFVKGYLEEFTAWVRRVGG